MSITTHKDFLKSGDPALTWPHGRHVTPGNPRGVPNGPDGPDPVSTRNRANAEWLAHVEAGRIG